MAKKWRRKNNINEASRIDFFLTCPEIRTQIESTDIRPAIITHTDHQAISLMMKCRSQHKGKGYFKKNNCVLENNEYQNIVKKLIKQYECTVLLTNDIGLQWDLFKTEIRDYTIAFCKRKAQNNGNSPLHQAASRGEENMVKALVGLGANVSAVNIEGASPLHKAAMQGSVNITDILIRNTATVNVTDSNGTTPLHHAAMEGNIKLTELLIRNNADVNATDNVGTTPLHHAAMEGNIKLTELLIRNNADVNATDNVGTTPLHHAAMEGNIKLTELLIRNNADVNATDNVMVDEY
ncbi:26S proteasome non-ATPase regulatory subunit 10-like [Mytilus trossulus]|uniref:26S proteasome non-ATPase regulatory subunit 10-like n=1 Tax=Mytilus trossulus TaxID=6551 RepID=UPI003005949D